jgi:DNA polymerase-3 subunit delta
VSIDGAGELKSELAGIREGNPRPTYLVFGAESYLVRTATEALTDALTTALSAETVRVDAQGKDAAHVVEPLTEMSLFASAQVTVVRNFAHLLSGSAADTLIAGIETGLAAGNAVVFSAPGGAPGDPAKVDKRGKGFKGLARIGSVLELNTQKPDVIVEWLRSRASREGKKLTRAGASLLLERVGPDMETLSEELEKAVLFRWKEDTIDAVHLESLVGKTREDAVWDITGAVMSGNSARAMELLADLLASGVYPLVLLTLLVRQGRHLLQARLLWERAGRPAFRDPAGFRSRIASTFETGEFGKGADDVTGIHPYASFKRFEAATDYRLEDLRRMVSRLRRADREAKTGTLTGPREVLEELILDLCAMEGSVA